MPAASWYQKLRLKATLLTVKHFPDLAQKISALRVEDAERSGADILTTSCPFCYQSLKATIDAKGSKLRMTDLMELLRTSL